MARINDKNIKKKIKGVDDKKVDKKDLMKSIDEKKDIMENQKPIQK